MSPDVNYSNSLDDSHCTEMQKDALLMYATFPFKSTHLHITVCEILIEKGCFKMFQLMRIWSISQYLAVRSWLTTLFHLRYTSVLGLFCFFLCTLPCILTPLLPLGCWPWWFSGCSSIVRVCNSCVVLCLYMLSNWRFMRCTFELFQRTGLSLVDLHSLH